MYSHAESPSSTAPALHEPELLDDVFGCDDFPSHDRILVSDVPRLRAQHHTSGYREGFIAAKAASVQAGFDEGFALGAAIGTRAGELLGLLEGIAEALLAAAAAADTGEPYAGAVADAGVAAAATEQAATTEKPALAESVHKLLDRARRELATEGVYKPEYWAPDGTWLFEVDGRAGKPADEADEVVFADVAEAHPVVRKWAAIVRGQMEIWSLDRDVLAGREGGDGRENEDRDGEKAGPALSGGDKTGRGGAAMGNKGVLEW